MSHPCLSLLSSPVNISVGVCFCFLCLQLVALVGCIVLNCSITQHLEVLSLLWQAGGEMSLFFTCFDHLHVLLSYFSGSSYI